ncbi:hypothetical protein CHLNCDRAFT_145133 [Chlorella variabilis]|uniref:ribonuclease Z n=1 Tax=Chlorella variabilis TaxID=554065 RepID=E1ZCN5_CHLVA|nr:hypothetical protein CHLNCDRAFT_145133 [Chlorella variabilis]EFN56466.1 hypothetical protein CHLNCDRAFT_145133 [Chlorella variabilis]|eukprot:XP_005848568.1 hypothetical protein CHLNCDRAFT_145133 [Chlorella variabilis]
MSAAAAVPPRRRQQPAAGDDADDVAVVLAFVCHLRASDQLLLLTNLHSKGAVAQLQRHPALALLQSQGSRLAGVLHMAAPGVAGSSALRQLCHQLQPAVAAGPAAGQQLLLEQAGAHAGAQVIGHLAAARTNAKLHVPSSAEHDGQQGQEQEESVGLVAEQLAADCHQAMAAGAVAVSSSASGVVSIRHVSLVTWKQRPPEEQPQPRQLASSGAAATGACPGGGAVSQQQQPRAAAVLVVEPGEGFADDAWCAASAVQQGRPLLVAALERLQEQQQRGLLPSRELSAAGAATWQCRQNLLPDAGGGLAANKRAADSIRARLQGGKRPRAPEGGGDGGSSAAGPQQPQQSLPPEEPRWLRGAPASICQLASGGAAGCAPEVVFLGTGSAEPSKLPCGQSLLLDCGEGALGALRRAHGAAAAMRQVASLGCLWVSHRHADHMSGVASLLAAYPASLPPLLVVGPRSLRDWLAEAAPALRLAGRYRFVHCAELNRPDHWARQALRRHLGITHLQCVPVRHCSDAYGLVLQHEQGWSLVYSGDTQPCQQLVQAGRGCTLLIHEATFEPCLEQQARQKRHSTTAEALEVAQRMGAYRCILTHFSQRYPKWPQGLDQLQADEEARSPEGAELDGGKGGTPAAPTSSLAAAATAAVAFDGMRVPLALLPVLPALMPAVQAALADPEDGEAEGDGDGDTAGGA